LAEEVTGDLKLAVDEACANVIKHAYRGDTSREIVVKYALTERDLRIAIEDTGEKARPELMQGRDLDDIRPGGLGLHFIKRVFDTVTYDPKKKKGNRLLLIKHLESRDED
jgi:anti-sigma regulatory factor (Ser/Thr protein kinase)